MKVTSSVFDGSAPRLADCPRPTHPEFAFIGRSNVGKSTLINLISGRKDLARVSDRPGFTQLINFFTINRAWRLVDLPGYGYAKVAKQKREGFAALIQEYLSQREGLACTFVLIDASIPPQQIDLEFVCWMGSVGRPFVLVFTKTDKASAAEVEAHIAQFQEATAQWFAEPLEAFRVSAKKQEGVRELLAVIAETRV
jgi:GTP-binding protein